MPVLAANRVATAGAAPAALGPDYSVQYLAPFSVIFAVAVATSVARIYCRARLRVLGWTDWTFIFGFVLTIFWFIGDVFLYTNYGRGVQNYLPNMAVVGPIEVSLGIVYNWATNVLRISMGLMLLELKDEPSWRWPLRVLILVQACLIVGTMSFQLDICHPLSSIWAPTPDAHCISLQGELQYAYTFNAFNIASDVIISVMPLTFIRSVRRSVTEKVLLCGLMAFGLLASTAAIITLASVLGVLQASDAALEVVYFDVLSSLQLFLGAIAANLPYLKAPVQRLLTDWGLVSPRRHAALDRSPESFLDDLTQGSHIARQLEGLTAGDESDRKDSKNASSSSCTDGVSQRQGSDSTHVDTADAEKGHVGGRREQGKSAR